jgi:hypothetical protein
MYCGRVGGFLVAFESYMRGTKPLSSVTIDNHVIFIRRFLYTVFRKSSFLRGAVTIAAVRNYLS